MDLLPKVGGTDPYSGDQRPGTGAFARKRKPARSGQRPGDEADPPAAAADVALDPLLAELDRLRAVDPSLTESGAHRAVMALRAYHQTPPAIPLALPGPPTGGVASDAASSETAP